MMALRFIDSYDYLATADLNKKYALGSSPSIESGTGRNGTNALKFGSANVTVTKTLNAQQTWIIGVARKFNALPGSTVALLDVLDAGTIQVRLTLTTSGEIEARRSTATVLGTSSGLGILGGAWYFIELKVSIADAGGTYEVRVNGVTVLSGTGDTKATANATADGFTIYGASTALADDLYICDGTGSVNNDFLGDRRVIAVLPNGAGNYSQWTPAATLATGDRREVITVTTSMALDPGEDMNTLVDGVTGVNNLIVSGAAGSWIRFQFATAVIITEILWKQNATSTHGTCQIQGSNDGSSWTNIGSTFTLGGATNQTITAPSGNTTAYTYYQLVGPFVTTHLYEVEFPGISPATAATLANYQCADESATDSDATYNSSSTAGQIDTYAFGAVGVSGVVSGIQTSLLVRKDDAGSRVIREKLRISGSDYSGSNVSLSDSALYAVNVRETNPATAAAWTVSEIDAAEFGVELVS